MLPLLESQRLDEAAVAVALEGLDTRGATRQACIRADGRNACVNAVYAGGDDPAGYLEAAARRAATTGRRLLPVLDSGEIDGRLWIAYDMGSMTPLTDHFGRLLPTATSLGVISDVARALDDAAGDGVLAAELPPSSVFMAGRSARLGDLGTARAGFAGTEYELEGDPFYVAPEVLRGERAGERSGVYLFGALLYYLLTGGSPQRLRSAPFAGGRPDLPASINAIVATALADDPERRQGSAGEIHEMARRALRGEPPARPRRRPSLRASSARPPRSTKAPRVRRLPTAVSRIRGRLAAATRPGRRRSAAATRPGRRLLAAANRGGRLPAAAICGALVLGAATGVLLGRSPDSEGPRVQSVTVGDLAVTLSSGRQRVEGRDQGLSVQAPESRLRARIVDRPVEPRPGARPVRLGALQAWRHAAQGVVGYAIPTTEGTLEVTCRGSASATSRPLRLCERTASTLELRDGRALRLAAVADDSRRLRAALATLSAERDSARARLGRASTPSGQRLAAEDLAASHRRAATALDSLTGAESIETAMRGAADAYSTLAASAKRRSAGGWEEASERVRRSEVILAEAIAAAG